MYENMDELKEKILNCKKCKLCTNRNNIVFGEGNKQADIMFIGGRLSAKYDELSKIAPVVYLSTDMDIGLLESIKKNAGIIASIFGKENEATEKIQNLESRIKKLNEKANGRTAVLGMVTSGSCNLLGNRGRLNLITREIGFTNLGANLNKEKNKGRKLSAQEAASQAHGEESSFELISKLNPEYIFILDRDSAIGTKGARLAKDVMENEIVSMTKAAKNGKLIILDYPAIWYTAEGGITSLEYMIKDLENHI